MIGLAAPAKCLVAHAEFEPSEIQDLAEIIPNLLKAKAQFNTPLKFLLQIELGDGKERPSDESTKEISKLLSDLKQGFEFH